MVRQPKNQFNQRHFVHNTTNNTSAHTSLNNTNTIIPPRPPASSDFKLIGECDWPTLHGGARSSQHGNAIFKEKKSFFILYIFLFHGQLISMHADKRCVY